MFRVRHQLLCFGIDVKKPFHLASFHQMLPDNVYGIRRLYLNIERIVWNHFNHRPFFTKAEATGTDHLDGLLQSLSFDGLFQILKYKFTL